MQFTAILAIAAASVGVAAQDLPTGECFSICLTNMLAKASELGCGNTDTACLCRNANFVYGIRDCTLAVCQGDTAKVNQAIEFGRSVCAGAGVTDIPGVTAGPVATASGVVSSVTSVVTGADGAVSTVTGSVVATAVTSSISVPVVSTGANGEPTTISTATIPATGTVLTTELPEATGDATGDSTTGPTSATSSGLAAQFTAAPAMGFMAAAGLAALLL